VTEQLWRIGVAVGGVFFHLQPAKTKKKEERRKKKEEESIRTTDMNEV
jgi:hypothetical protein